MITTTKTIAASAPIASRIGIPERERGFSTRVPLGSRKTCVPLGGGGGVIGAPVRGAGLGGASGAERVVLEAYFAAGPLEWYPEWDIQLGQPLSTAATFDELARDGVYRRDFTGGTVLVNPSPRAVRVQLGRAFRQVEFAGGGALGPDGVPGGRLTSRRVRTVDLAPTSGEILLHD